MDNIVFKWFYFSRCTNMKSLSNADNGIKIANNSGNRCLLILIYKNKFQQKSAFTSTLKHVINSSVKNTSDICQCKLRLAK